MYGTSVTSSGKTFPLQSSVPWHISIGFLSLMIVWAVKNKNSLACQIQFLTVAPKRTWGSHNAASARPYQTFSGFRNLFHKIGKRQNEWARMSLGIGDDGVVQIEPVGVLFLNTFELRPRAYFGTHQGCLLCVNSWWYSVLLVLFSLHALLGILLNATWPSNNFPTIYIHRGQNTIDTV